MSVSDPRQPVPAAGPRAVERLLHDYCACIDARDVEGLVALFVEDLLLDLGTTEKLQIRGRSQYRPWIAEQVAHFAATRHVITHLEVETSVDGVLRVDSGIEAWHRFRSGREGTLRGRYEDVISLTPAGARFVRRRLLVEEEQGMPGPWHRLSPEGRSQVTLATNGD